MDIHGAFRSTAEVHDLAESCFEVGHPLREIWDQSLAAGSNQTQQYYNTLTIQRQERKLVRDSQIIEDRRLAVPRWFYPEIVAETERWTSLGVKIDGERLRLWLSQPAELVWMMSKGRTAACWFPGRTLKVTVKQWLVALYGGDVDIGSPDPVTGEYSSRKSFDPIDAEQIRRFIRRSIRKVDEFVDEDPELQANTLSDLAADPLKLHWTV